MSRVLGSVIGALLGVMVAALVLVGSQSQQCSEDWWQCSPASWDQRAIQMAGLGLLLFGPVIGFRLGERFAPAIDRRAALFGALGALPGRLATALGVRLPYCAPALLVGGAAGLVLDRVLRRSADRTS